MDENVRTTEYGEKSSGNREDDRVSEWELGLPNPDDLLSLSHQLISPELASAFSISPELHRTISDVDRASKTTIERLRSKTVPVDNSNNNNNNNENDDVEDDIDDMTKAMKRPRLVWTPQLHKRFVDVVSHLGLKNAVPKTIMNMMNVEGLTRENVASHLQKYRLYLKRMEGGREESESGGGGAGSGVGLPVMMHLPMVSGGSGYPWIQSGGGSYHHSRGNDN